MDKTIALYMRLSDEDDNLAAHEESNSISHQRKLMLDHIQKLPELKDCNIMEFSDDGYSGADFSRPNFVKMMDLVKAGKIQVIVTKDYSRLGRDYLEVGNYMECIFPVLQVRYISVNDNYDSANSFGSTGGMSVALKNLVNALYCKDASKKVRAAKAVLAKQGKYIAAFAPFGYQKSEDDKHMLVPDPVTAPVVQLIFELAIKGMKYTEIANYLNNNGYDSIFEYYQKIGVKRCYERDIGEHMWSASTVMEILYNEGDRSSQRSKLASLLANRSDTLIASDVASVCVILNGSTEKLVEDKFSVSTLKTVTLNKLYVALTRSKGDLYIVTQDEFETVKEKYYKIGE